MSVGARPESIFNDNIHPRGVSIGDDVKRWLEELVLPRQAIWTAMSADSATSDYYVLTAASHEWLMNAIDPLGNILTFVADVERGHLPFFVD